MATTMAATRQPFAPINGSRLQNLTSLKNRQNALLSTLSSPTKRKATTYEDDSENVDPIIFFSPKKSKNATGSRKDTVTKPVNYFLTKAPPSPNDFSAAFKPTPLASPRPSLTARSAGPKLNTSLSSKPTPSSAPAGRSPTRKRIGILNRRRTTSPFTRVDPPKFNTPSPSLGFSIDAALSGTIPSYTSKGARTSEPRNAEPSLNIPLLHTPAPKDSWFFDIHEDTEEELATNLMEHSTCTLDISSDEESILQVKNERGKENVPPLDDISQTRTRLRPESSVPSLKAHRREVDADAIDIDRSALGELSAEDFYAEGCNEKSVFIVPGEEEEEGSVPMSFDFGAGSGKDVEALMSRAEGEAGKKAALLEPIEKAEEGFDVWESGSVKGDE